MKKLPRIIAAIIAKDQSELDNYLSLLENKIKHVMLDFMDGSFVPQVSLDFQYKLPSRFIYEGHLMVKNPFKYLNNIHPKIDTVTLHIETIKNEKLLLEQLSNREQKTFLAMNPSTDIDSIKPYINEIDGVLIMTVEPGRYGARFLPQTLEKVRELRRIDEDLYIEVDGGMDPVNAKKAKKAGADAFVSGSYILNSENIDKAIKELEKAVS